MKKKIEYRKNNYQADESRTGQGIILHPILWDGLKHIAKAEKRSMSWVIETALADYLGILVTLKKLKTHPKPSKLQTYDRTGEVYNNHKGRNK